MTDPGPQDERVDRLYALPLAEFTGARNALAKELGKEGDRAAAAVVKGLKKPSIEGWAVNQLVREHGGEVGRLVELGEEQAEVLGSGDRDRVRKAMDDVKGTLSSLTDHAEHLLRGTERKPTPALLERVTRLLQTAAATDEGRAALREGRFVGELEQGDLPEVDLTTPPPPRAPRDRPTPDAAEREDAKAEAKEAARERAERDAEVARLERSLRRAEQHAQLLRDRADDLDKRAAEAREAAAEAEDEAEAARAAVVARKGD